MGNEVAKPFGNSAVLKDRETMARRAAESAQTGARGGAPDGSDYLNFSGKRGVYTIGQDKRRVENDEMWLLNIASLEDGWVCWKGGKPASTRMANIFTGVPVQAPDPQEGGPFDHGRGEGWAQAKGWVAKSLDNDQQGYFKINSVSGVGEMADMIEEISRRLATGEPCWPIFFYDMEEFEAQGYKNFKPIFKTYGWIDDEQLDVLAKDPDADIDELIEMAAVASMGNKPKKVADKKDEAKSDDATTSDEPPARSRRRRRAS